MLLKILQNKSDLKAVYVMAQKWYLAQKAGVLLKSSVGSLKVLGIVHVFTKIFKAFLFMKKRFINFPLFLIDL